MSFIRLHITVEGQTEERFVNKILAKYLDHSKMSVSASCITTMIDKKRNVTHKGGLPNYKIAKDNITSLLKHNKKAQEFRLTTMFDLYALPNDFPEYDKALQIKDKYAKVKFLEEELAKNINDTKFIPYIQLHEFEAIILADPKHLDIAHPDYDKEIKKIIAMVADGNPELINDNYDTIPSRRIIKEIPEYDKAASGPIVAGEIGIAKIREKCKHFDNWLTTLEALGR
ncbi:MAG: DUF4276 family protein [Nitrospirae bacterium]|nr:DUF4276 family protein [Nitrospirota bacterium]